MSIARICSSTLRNQAYSWFAVLCATAASACTSPPAAVPADTGAVVDVAAPTDATADAAPDVAAADTAVVCPAPPAPAPVDPKRHRFGLALFHFNVEYVIGGLEWQDPLGKVLLFLDIAANAGWTNDAVEDYIVRETFRPLLDMYDKHPTWGVDMELQAYMVEVMAARHPDTLVLLRKLAQRGQVELISFHYAAQLFLAFPREDLHRSIQRTREVFAKHCLPLSDVVFNQEGQAGEGWQKMLVDEGYKIGVFPKNLHGYVHDGATPWPLYAAEGGDLIIGPGAIDPAAGIELSWHFFDDGELRAVQNKPVQLNPYFAPNAPHLPERVAEFEADLLAAEKSGIHMTHISDYVRHLKARGVVAKKAPPLLDGTWQAPSTDSIHRWLGGRGVTFWQVEQDNAVRAGNAVARMHVAATQVLVEHAVKAGKATAAHQQALRELWRDLWHAEVSDCSGVNPWLGEVQFGLARNAKILKGTEGLRNSLLASQGGDGTAVGGADVDLETRTVQLRSAPLAKGTPADALPPAEPLAAGVEPPLFAPVETDSRTVTKTWAKVPLPPGEKGPERWRLTVQFGAACDDCTEARAAAVLFARTQDAIEYSPGLLETEVRSYPFSAFKFKQNKVFLPLPNGLIGLGDGWYAIKHVRVVHVALRVVPEDKVMAFVDTTIPLTPTTWQFEVVHGTAAEALAIANRINIHPLVRY